MTKVCGLRKITLASPKYPIQEASKNAKTRKISKEWDKIREKQLKKTSFVSTVEKRR